MAVFSLVAMTGFEICCLTSSYMQWLFHSGERAVAFGPLVIIIFIIIITIHLKYCYYFYYYPLLLLLLIIIIII